MSKTKQNYSVLYKINLTLSTKSENNVHENIKIPSSDIVSISFINEYDTATFPIIRVRLYSDLKVIEQLTSAPDNIYVNIRFDGRIYDMNTSDDKKSPTPVTGACDKTLFLKGYIENKNILVNKFDSYDNGIKRDESLNIDRKVPIEIYCYNSEMIHFTKQRSPSIFKDMSISSVITSLFRKQGSLKYQIDPIQNQNRYNQILIPNLDINETLSFFDEKYGLYPAGAQVYGEDDILYITTSDVNNGSKPLPIRVESYKSNGDMGGMRKINNTMYQMNTKADNVSIVSETDIEKVLNTEYTSAINLNDMSVDTTVLSKLYKDLDKDISNRVSRSVMMDRCKKLIYNNLLQSPNILHKTVNQYVASMYNARITERITRIDISGVGFDIFKLKINSRYNIIFDSPIRGMSINQVYRASVVSHVISNLDSDLFIANTTMSLCSN